MQIYITILICQLISYFSEEFFLQNLKAAKALLKMVSYKMRTSILVKIGGQLSKRGLAVREK